VANFPLNLLVPTINLRASITLFVVDYKSVGARIADVTGISGIFAMIIVVLLEYFDIEKQHYGRICNVFSETVQRFSSYYGRSGLRTEIFLL